MSYQTTNVLIRQNEPCPLPDSYSPSSCFFMTNDVEAYHKNKQNQLAEELHFVDLNNNDTSNQTAAALEKYLQNQGQNIIFACKEPEDLQKNWQPWCAFLFAILKICENHPCKFLLLTDAMNPYADLIYGSALSLAQETVDFQFVRLEVRDDFYQNANDFFHACFNTSYHHLVLQQNKIFYEKWHAAELTNKPQPINGNILITGGTGALGQLLAKFLAQSLNCQVFLIGRRPLSEDVKHSLQATGAKTYFQADCTSYEDMKNIFLHIQQNYGPINTVFHLAGMLNDNFLQHKTSDRFIKTMQPKVAGAYVLQALSQSYAVQRVVLFSSLSAVVGNAGQTDYAGANAFLNALAEKNMRRQPQTRWNVINWGLWETDSGMQMTAESLAPLPCEKGFQILGQLIADDVVISTVYQGDEALIEGKMTAHGNNQTATTSNVTEVSADEVQNWVTEVIIKFTKFQQLGPEDSLLEMGVDSIIATHITAHIEHQLSKIDSAIKISRTLVFQNPTVKSITQHLIDKHGDILQAYLGQHQAPSPFQARQPTSGDQTRDTSHIDVTATPHNRHSEPAQVPTAHNEDIRDSDIAIIGMAGEFPEANNLLQFWELIKNGHSGIKPIPDSRWHWQHDFVADMNQPGQSYSRQGGFIEHAKLFDHEYFNIAPVDAEKMDPQARRLLHQTKFALDDCHYFDNPASEVGVFTAAMYGHYQNLDASQSLFDSSFAAIANYISYAFDFQGPSLCVDTMCSGSLTALHLAVNSLKQDECQAAVVGGVNIMSHPGKYRFLSEQKFLSLTGHCHSFGIAADGYVPGEGAIVFVLKPARQAKADNDPIYGIIRGSAVNTNGRGSGFTVPSSQAQARVVSKAFDKASIQPSDIGYVEAHGTGTALGDPIEVEGLSMAYGNNHGPIPIGALKSNIGHLESAAGLASVTKVLLQMHYGRLVPTINANIENPYVDLQTGNFYLQKALSPWPTRAYPIFAGVSSFGAGGSNAHVILQSPPETNQKTSIAPPRHQFNSEVLWRSVTNEPSQSVSQTNPQKAQSQVKPRFANTVLLKPESVPVAKRHQPSQTQNIIYFCTQAQKQTLQLQPVSTQHLLIDDLSQLESYFKEDHGHQQCHLINISPLDLNQSYHDFTAAQFNLAQFLTHFNRPIYYQHYQKYPIPYGDALAYNAFSALFRTLTLEKSNIAMNLVETDQDSFAVYTETSNTSLPFEQNYTHYQFHNGQIFEQVFQEDSACLSGLPSPLLKQGGIYIVVGGLGDIGYLITQYLLQSLEATVIVWGRSELKHDKAQKFHQLKQISQQIEYYPVDINDFDAVSTTIHTILARHPKPNGIIHSASVLNDGLLSKKNYSDFYTVIEGKTIGTRNLDEATKTLPLDFFVMFSSVSSVFGNAGQADYCVGNTFLDQFAHYRDQQVKLHKRSGKTITINWPAWQVENLALDQTTMDFIQETTGITPLEQSDGLALFQQLMDTETPTQIAPLKGDPNEIRKKLDTHFEDFPKVAEEKADTSDDTTDILGTLKNLVHQVTKMDTTKITDETSFGELGLSSVLMTELAQKLEQTYDIAFAPSVFFTYNTLQKTAAYILKKIGSQTSSSQSPITNQTSMSLTQSAEEYAIVGMDGLLPGGPELNQFWQSLVNNQCAVKPVSRWPNRDYYAATLPDISQFDPKFFGLSNREAMLMDPQHRLFLEVAYEALLNGGYPPSRLNNVGVFVGVQFNDYHNLLQQYHQNQHPYAATGNAHAMLANRVSYLFDFQGPSQTIDTACSSTLVAMNQGLLALKNGQCDAVLTGAVSLLIDPSITDAANTMGVLSPRYRCATFDEEADGYVRGEGVGCFLIKRRRDAERDLDPIHAVIKGFAENHGGRANSLTAPNPIAQKQLITSAYNESLSKQVSYIETHGTGTKLGDPVEIDALKQAFSELNPDAKPNTVKLGAVKSNVGHLEPAAGIASIMKVIYAFKHHMIPANVNLHRYNPYIQLEGSPFTIPHSNQPWTEPSPRVAGISSFGFGGSNAHLILAEPTQSRQPSASQTKMQLFALSAKTTHSLNQMRQALAQHLLAQKSTLELESLSFTLNCCRDHFQHRLIFAAQDIDSLISLLLSDPMTNLDRTDMSVPSNLYQMGTRYLRGENVDWHDCYQQQTIQKLHLPGYCFDNQNYWFDQIVQNQTEEANR